MSTPPPTPPGGLSPSLRVLLGLAAATIALAGLFLARDIFGPLAVGAVIVIICAQVRPFLIRRGWREWAATGGVIVTGYLVLIALFGLIAVAGIQFGALVNKYSDQLSKTASDVVSWAQSLGVDSGTASSGASAVFSPSALLGYAQTFGGSAITALTGFFFVLAYVIFMAADSGRIGHARERFGPDAAPVLSRFESYSRDVRSYYIVNAVFGLIVAVADGLALWLLGIPAPLVWAILSFVTNFIPQIGFVLGLIPPALLALVVGGPGLMIAVIAIYIVLNMVLQVMVQPKFVSDTVGLSLTLSFMSVTFWTFIIGPVGAILSIPLTLLVREVVLGISPETRWLRWLSGDDKATEDLPDDADDPPDKTSASSPKKTSADRSKKSTADQKKS